MAKYLRYKGEFLSRAGIVWRVEILQDATKPFAEVGELTFEADEALSIEWGTTDKTDVICGSTATLHIESPGDRTYEDLYTIEPGNIRMDVYRENSLYWSGTLDPEFYEEPYERAANYPVSLIFSDFGIFDRLKYDLSGMQSLQTILNYAIDRSGINHCGVEGDTLISTYFEDGSKLTLDSVMVRSDNFVDEEGEASTLEEVVEGVLQPLALRLIQRAGKIYVYDLNGLCSHAPRRRIHWDGDSSTMGTDKVVNNVRINFSPYAAAECLGGEVVYKGDYSDDNRNLTNTPEMLGDSTYYSYYPDYSTDHLRDGNWDYTLIDFTIFHSPSGTGLAEINPSAAYFKIMPVYGSGSACEGVAWGFYTGGHGSLKSGYPRRVLNKTPYTAKETPVLMRTERVYIPDIGAAADKPISHYLRLSLEMLLDPRYNPFSSPDEGNEEDNYNDLKNKTAWAFIPVSVNLYDADGNPLLHYVNKPIAESVAIGSLAYAKGHWETGAASFGDAYLEYYNPENPKEETGIMGWQTNRHCIGCADPAHFSKRNTLYTGSFSSVQIYESFAKMPAGEYIPYPSKGGWLEITVYAGVKCYKYLKTFNPITGDSIGQILGETYGHWTDAQYDKIRWHLYKAPKLEIVKKNLKLDKDELDDIEYSGYINKAAKDDMSIDTICGTSPVISPAARGIYCRTADSSQVKKLTRAGITDYPERLLIGTIYSQYAGRRVKLQGECVLDPGGLCTYSEANQDGKILLMSGEVQNVISDTTEATLVELRPDEYIAIEEVEN